MMNCGSAKKRLTLYLMLNIYMVMMVQLFKQNIKSLLIRKTIQPLWNMVVSNI